MQIDMKLTEAKHLNTKATSHNNATIRSNTHTKRVFIRSRYANLVIERSNEAAISRKHTHSLVVGVANEEIASAISYQTTRILKLSILFAEFAEFAQKLAIGVEHLSKVHKTQWQQRRETCTL